MRDQQFVIPAQAGIQNIIGDLDPGLRRGDGKDSHGAFLGQPVKAAGLTAVLIAALSAAIPGRCLGISDEDAFDAMKKEMSRSLTQLHEEAFAPPYFIAYRLVSDVNFKASSAFGALGAKREMQFGTLYVEVREGNQHLDNTNLQFEGLSDSSHEDPFVLREDLWRMTDEAYKSAIAGYLTRKAERLTQYNPDILDDFSQEKPAVSAEPQIPPHLDEAKGVDLINDLSSVFKGYPDIERGQSRINLDWQRRLLLTSEGTRIAGPYQSDPDILELIAETRAPDGMKLEQVDSWVAPDFAGFPPLQVLKAAAEQMAQDLEEERQAPVQPPMAAPAILDPEFTGVLFHEGLGHKLEGQRQRDPRQEQIFKGMVGRGILPEFLSVIDDPTLERFQGQMTHGFYRFDSEGVPAQRIVLVDRGILRNFLMSRWPIKGFEQSNGHGRSSADLRPTGRMSNLIVEAQNPVPLPQLDERLLNLIQKSGKPYGFLLVGASGGDNQAVIGAAQTLEIQPKMIYRVAAKTGAKTLVRGVAMVGTPLDVMNRIVAAADDAKICNFGFCGAESGEVPVSQIAPSVLVSQIELQRLPEDRRRPPILSSPLDEKR